MISPKQFLARCVLVLAGVGAVAIILWVLPLKALLVPLALVGVLVLFMWALSNA